MKIYIKPHIKSNRDPKGNNPTQPNRDAKENKPTKMSIINTYKSLAYLVNLQYKKVN